MDKKITVIETDVWVKNEEKPGLLRKVRNKTIKEVYDETVQFLKEQNVYDELDYFLISHSLEKEEFPDWRWIACYAVVGGSEGHYIHVEIIPSDGSRNIHVFTGKTFLRMDHALKVSNLLTKVFWDEM